KMQRGGHHILATRPSSQYGAGHIPGSLHIALNGQFASWAGSLIKPDIPLLVVAEEPEGVREAQTRLARVGLERVSGYLKDGVIAWHMANLPLPAMERSEEHTSELQSRFDLVCRLLLEKKNPREHQP